MYRLIRGIVVIAVLAPLTLSGQAAARYDAHAVGRAQQRHKASLVPPPTPAPEVVDALPLPLAPLTTQEMPAQPPSVTYINGVLTVDAQNSALSDILKAISKSTGAEFDPMPEVAERTMVHLSGSSGDVVSSLLRGSTYGYVLISSQEDSAILQKVLLIAPEPVKGAKSAMAKATPPRRAPAPAVTEPVAAPISSESVIPAADTATAPAVAPPTSSASLAEGPLISYPRQQGGVDVPDPTQFIEKVNQQNAANPDKSQQQMSGAGQYMQELYKLRVQQQTGQTSSAQPSSMATQH